jgi:hypothetical protein
MALGRKTRGLLHLAGEANMKSLTFTLLMFLSCVSAAWADDSASQPKEPSHVSQLKWLDSADPDKMLQADIKKGLYQFYVACGFTCEPPGLNKIDAVQCFPVSKLLRMAGTADALESEEDRTYQDKAIRFATRYNVQLLEYLSKRGLTDCVVGESWQDALFEMDKRLKDQDVTGDFVDLAYSKQSHKFTLSAHLSPENRNAHIEEMLCGITLLHHLSGKVIMEIYDQKNSVPPSSVECRYGEMLPSDWKPKPTDYPYESLEN